MSNNSNLGQQAMEQSIEILRNLLLLEDTKIIPNKCQNERYLHHYYSKNIQERYKIDFSNFNFGIGFSFTSD